jgi:hypothetical protein
MRIPIATQRGRGVIDDVFNKIKGPEKDLTRPGFPGEHHMTMIDGPDKGYIARYMGPGTKIKERLKRGDPPLNDVDAVAKAHDIAYSTAFEISNKQERQGAIVDADKIFLKNITRTKDAPLTAALGKKLIQLKMVAERAGLLPPTIFSGGLFNKEELRKSELQLLPPVHFLREQKGGIAPLLLIPAVIGAVATAARIMDGYAMHLRKN